jgi:hypothetical protein
LLLEVRLYFNWLFDCFIIGNGLFFRLFLYERLFCHTFAGFLIFFLVILLPEIIETVIKIILVTLTSELILCFRGLNFGFALAGGLMDGQFFIDY